MISKFCKFSAFSLEFQKFSRTLEQLFLTIGQNNFGNKIPISYPWAQFCMTSGSALMSALDSSSTMSRPIIKWLQSLRNSSNLAVLFEIICSCCHFNLSASCTSVFLASTRAEIQFGTLVKDIYFSESLNPIGILPGIL